MLLAFATGLGLGVRVRVRVRVRVVALPYVCSINQQKIILGYLLTVFPFLLV